MKLKSKMRKKNDIRKFCSWLNGGFVGYLVTYEKFISLLGINRESFYVYEVRNGLLYIYTNEYPKDDNIRYLITATNIERITNAAWFAIDFNKYFHEVPFTTYIDEINYIAECVSLYDSKRHRFKTLDSIKYLKEKDIMSPTYIHIDKNDKSVKKSDLEIFLQITSVDNISFNTIYNTIITILRKNNLVNTRDIQTILVAISNVYNGILYTTTQHITKRITVNVSKADLFNSLTLMSLNSASDLILRNYSII